MGNPWINRRDEPMRIVLVSQQPMLLRFSVTRSADLVGEGFGVRQRALDEHARPTEMARRPFYGLGFLVHREDFPYGHAMPSEVRLPARQ